MADLPALHIVQSRYLRVSFSCISRFLTVQSPPVFILPTILPINSELSLITLSTPWYSTNRFIHLNSGPSQVWSFLPAQLTSILSVQSQFWILPETSLLFLVHVLDVLTFQFPRILCAQTQHISDFPIPHTSRNLTLISNYSHSYHMKLNILFCIFSARICLYFDFCRILAIACLLGRDACSALPAICVFHFGWSLNFV